MKLRLLAKENIKLDEALNFLEMYLEIHGCNSRDTILRIRPLCYATAVETKGLNPLLWRSILQENSSSNAQGASRSDSKTDSSSKCVIYKFNGSNPDSAQIFTILSIIVELSEKSAEQVEADEAQNSEVGKEAGQKVRDRTRQKKFCVKSEAAKEPMARYDDITNGKMPLMLILSVRFTTLFQLRTGKQWNEKTNLSAKRKPKVGNAWHIQASNIFADQTSTAQNEIVAKFSSKTTSQQRNECSSTTAETADGQH
ncbi:Fructokinase-like 2,chloroplastic [Trichinella pseudospiralis]